MKDTRVAHCGNIANNAYIYVKQLRRKGYDVDLIMDFGEHVMSFPQWEDGDFELFGIRTATKGLMLDDVVKIIGKEKWGELPEWVRFIGKGMKKRMKDPSIILDDLKDYGPKDIYRHSRTSSLKDPFLSLDWIKMMKEYDVLHTWGRPTAFAPKSGTPYIAHPVGGDILIACGEMKPQMITSDMYKEGFEKAKYVLSHDPGYLAFAKKLKLNNFLVFPFLIDTSKYRPTETELHNELHKRFDTDLILYNPARQDWHWKGSDKMIKAFGRFVKEKNRKAQLLLAEWGTNIEDSKKLIAKLGISKNVDFLPALGKSRLVEYYNASDIILDSFNHTDFSFQAFGTSTLEALACGKPVITDFLPEKLVEHFPGDVPIKNAKTVEQLFGRIVELGDEKERVDVGKRSRDWIMEHFDGERLVDKMMGLYEKALG